MKTEEEIVIKQYCKYLARKYRCNFLGAIKEIMQDLIRSKKWTI